MFSDCKEDGYLMLLLLILKTVYITAELPKMKKF